MHISKGITGFSRWTLGVFGQAYLPIVGKYYLMHISKLITGFSRWTLGVFGRPYWVVVGKYYLTHISKRITGFSRCTPGVFGRPYWVVVGKYYLMLIRIRCVYTHINSDQRVYLMVSRAKPGKIASSLILLANNTLCAAWSNARPKASRFDNKIAKRGAFCNFASEANSTLPAARQLAILCYFF